MAKVFPEESNLITKAPLIRRLVAMLYDTLICAALMLVTTGIYMAISSSIIGAENYDKMLESGATSSDTLLSSILFVTLYGFFGYFWTRTGQTLGMQVWHLRIQNKNSVSISWLQALLRFMMAIISLLCFGLGFLWMLIDKEGMTWHDRFSESVVVRIPKKARE
jgi:uncharacterized RDD family membrane protein YckC